MIYLGTSGWYYKHWARRFYPAGVVQHDWLGYYATKFSTVEVNNTFYRLPSQKMVQGWDEKTPDDFVFAFKGSRLVTHLKKLRNTADALHVFYERMKLVGHKLGIILWQLPPSLSLDVPLLEGFLAELDPGIRQAVEFRHQSWFTPEAYRVLEQYQVGLCIISAPTLPTIITTTAPFSYIRWHGKAALYATNYTDRELEDWAKTIRALPVDDVYGYFNNDAFAYAPTNCLHLINLLQQPTPT